MKLSLNLEQFILNILNSKILIISFLIFFISSEFYAQSAFNKYEGQDNVSSIIVDKKMFELMSKVNVDSSDKQMQQYLSLIKKLNTLKVFSTNNPRVITDMKITFDDYVKSGAFEELMRLNDTKSTTKILIKPSSTKNQVKELLMFIEGSKGGETILFSLTGDFDINEVSVLIDKMNIPGGDDLKKVSKK